MCVLMNLPENSTSKLEIVSAANSSQNHSIKGKEMASAASSQTPNGGSIIIKYTKLDFPHCNEQEDPLGWLNHSEHFF